MSIVRYTRSNRTYLIRAVAPINEIKTTARKKKKIKAKKIQTECSEDWYAGSLHSKIYFSHNLAADLVTASLLIAAISWRASDIRPNWNILRGLVSPIRTGASSSSVELDQTTTIDWLLGSYSLHPVSAV